MHNFLTDCKVVLAKAATSAGSTDFQSDWVDARGFESVTFIVSPTSITSGGVQHIAVQQSSDAGVADTAADLEGTKITVADDDDGQVFAVEIHRPRERYLRLHVDRATQNSAWGEIYCILALADRMPVSNNRTDAITSEIHVSPAEGTA